MKLPHPLESVFNMGEDTMEVDIDKEYGMTEVPINAAATPTEPPPDVKDADDVLVETRLDEVYDAAIGAFQNQSAYTEIIEPRFAARNAEVAANYLNIALAAANSRAKVKTDRKRANQAFVPYGQPNGKTTNNIVIADRNEILKMITIDNETKKL
jgi:hypothetical protein